MERRCVCAWAKGHRVILLTLVRFFVCPPVLSTAAVVAAAGRPARAAQGGRASRVLGAILGIAGGASAGVILSVRGVIGDLADLPKDSQVKAFSAAILKDKYPMATAEWMAEQQKTSAHTPTTPAKPTTK